MNRNIWILEEKELLQEVSGMGELSEPWHSKQVELLDRHLQLLHLYSQAKQNLENQKGNIIIIQFKRMVFQKSLSNFKNSDLFKKKEYTMNWDEVKYIFKIIKL